MSVFIDTGIFVAFQNAGDVNHARARELVKTLAEGRFGTVYTSDYVFDEAVAVALVRTGRSDNALAIGRIILGDVIKPFLILLRVDDDAFTEAWNIFTRYVNRGLSFTDCTSIALLRKMGIDSIISFDADFDGIVPRIS